MAYGDAVEMPVMNEFAKTEEKGLYKSVASGEPLFSSDDKFIHHTGRPCFTKSINEEKLLKTPDYSTP